MEDKEKVKTSWPETEIKVNCGVSEGIPYLRCTVDGVTYGSNSSYVGLHKLSRILTGTTSEDGDGVFIQNEPLMDLQYIDFFYGKQKENFSFGELPEPVTQEEWISEIAFRIRVVREWVENIDEDQEFSFKI